MNTALTSGISLKGMLKTRLVIIIMLFSSPLLAERIFLKNGTVVDGRIVQQSRTAVQIRTVDGRSMTLSKDTIRRIDYSYDPQKEAERKRRKKLQAEREKRRIEEKKAEENRQKQLAEEERQRLEKEKAEQEREKAAIEKKKQEENERIESERRKSLLRDREQERNRSMTSRWWIEPTFSIGAGPFQSAMSTFYWDTYQSFPLAMGGILAGGTVNPDDSLSQINSESTWHYSNFKNYNLGLRSGISNFVVELDIRAFRGSVSFIEAAAGKTGMIPMSDPPNRDWFHVVEMEKFSEDHTSLRAGYRFFNGNNLNATVYLGMRKVDARADFSYIGPIDDRGPTPEYYYEFSTESYLSMKGTGPEVSMELEKEIPTLSLILRARICLFQINLNASMKDQSLMYSTSAMEASPYFLEIDSLYRNAGGSLLLHTGYRIGDGTEVFLEWHGLRSDTYLERINSRLSTLEKPPGSILAAIAWAPDLDRKQGNAENIQTVTLGVSHHFEF